MGSEKTGRIRLDESRCGQGVGDSDNQPNLEEADSRSIAQTKAISNLASLMAIEPGSEAAR